MSAARPARRAEIGYTLVFSGAFLALGAQIAFLQLWLADFGLSPAAIGAVNLVAVATRIVAGLGAPALAARIGRPAETMAALAILAAAASIGLLVAPGLVGVLVCTVALAVAYAGLLPMVEAYAYGEADRLGFSYRRARSVGSLAFLAATFLTGVVVAHSGVDAVPIWMAASFLLAALGARGLGIAPTPGRPRPAWRAWGAMLAEPRFRSVMIVVTLLQSAHAVYYVYGSLHWAARGWTEPAIGALWSIGVLAEIALFMMSARFGPLDPARALALAAIASMLRWAALAADPPFAVTALVQTLHAGSFGLTHLATMAYVSAAVAPDERATAQALVMVLIGGVGMLVATAAAALAYPALGAGAFALAALSAAAAALLAVGLVTPEAAEPQPQTSTLGGDNRAPR